MIVMVREHRAPQAQRPYPRNLLGCCLVVIAVGFPAPLAAESPELIAPWTPVAVKADSSGVAGGVWGRSHRFANTALPAEIVALDEELLASPVRLVPCEFVAYERPPQWTYDHALAVSLLHDVRVRPRGLVALEKVSPIWDVMSRFEVGEAQWHPYWESQPLATAEPAAVRVGFHLHPAASGQTGRALAVVSNLSADQGVTAQVVLHLARIAVEPKNAKDALTGETLTYSGRRLTVPLEAMRMRLV
ncbi:MAG: hypothetical protein KJZ87_19395 [Thermoguttaceae bacterium]|nr:hypothetical protein [Thermoguttaceae bacterium]